MSTLGFQEAWLHDIRRERAALLVLVWRFRNGKKGRYGCKGHSVAGTPDGLNQIYANFLLVNLPVPQVLKAVFPRLP